MSRRVSPSSNRPYGVQRVCEVWGVPRSSLYGRRQGSKRARNRAEVGPPVSPRRRGPTPTTSDAELLAAIVRDLKESPFVGEGHRPVWARLRILRGIRVSRKRVLRLMREAKLLSPHRQPKGDPKAHDGRITTDRPDEIWATDGTNVQTVDEGKVWIFVAVDHFNTECLGVHVCKEGNRFAALQPFAMGLATYRNGVECGAGRGITARQDHGSQYTSDTYCNQVKAWGMSLSFAYVGEPETNGVAERFIRTLKEQIIHGRAYRGVEDLRRAVLNFVKLYNGQWRLEKLGYRTPLEARADASLQVAA